MSEQPQRPPSLVMRQGPRPNQAFPLHKTVLTLGRAADNDIVIDDAEVSRHHARLTLQGNDWVLEDLGSRNGTFVNGQRITGPVVLTPGCQVALGPDVLFSMEGGAPAPAWAPPAGSRPAGPQAWPQISSKGICNPRLGGVDGPGDSGADRRSGSGLLLPESPRH